MVAMKLARAAAIVAFLGAALVAIQALLSVIVLLPLAAIPLMAGIGILRRRVWSAYGYALSLFAQLLAIPLLWVKSGGVNVSPLEIASTAIVTAALVGLFFLAGRSLRAAGSPPGLAWPWVTVSALSVLPLIFVSAFVIPSASMENTLLLGDHVLVQTLPLPSPSRGGMIVFRAAGNRREDFVKRVIGIPGDRIRIAGKVVYRNGVALREPYVIHVTAYVDPYRENFPSQPGPFVQGAGREMLDRHVVNGEVVAPPKSYFVLGDNRDDSLDSRYQGFVAAADLLGKPLLIYYSEVPPELDAPGGKPTGPRHTRWNRILKLL